MGELMSKELEALKRLKWGLDITQEEHINLCECIEKGLKEHEQHKAIENELGIELTTLINAVKNGIYEKFEDGEYVKFNGLCMSIKPHKLKLNVNKKCLERGNDYFHFKDYGKTWALTKEELEK